MKLLCISDTHGQFGKFAPDTLPDADAVLFAGDFTNLGWMRPYEALCAQEWVLALARRYADVVFIFGNHDLDMIPSNLTSLAGNIHEATKVPITIGDLRVCGVNCSVCYNKEYLARQWRNTTFDSRVEQEAYTLPPCDVLISHCPSSGGLGYTSENQDAGAERLTDYIVRHSPRLVVCGHIHEAVGQDRIGQTLVVNTAMQAMLIDTEGL